MSNLTIADSTVKVVRGNLAEEPVDAIGLGVGEDFLPNGPASGAIFGAAGDGLQDEIGDTVANSPGDTLVTGGYGLLADHIILCSIDEDSERDDLEGFLVASYEAILSAASDNDDIQTLALPPLGTGDLDYSMKKASTSLVGALKNLEGQLDVDSVKVVAFETVQFCSVENFIDQAVEGTIDTGPNPNLF